MNAHIPPHHLPDDEPEQPTPPSITIEQAEQLLTHGEITALQNVRLWGSNYSTLVQISSDAHQATAIYKPQRGERPLWDFPDGTLCYRETAAYRVSEALGWHIVPPTVLREGPSGIGSIQLFVEHDPAINYFNLDDRFVTQLNHFAVFDALVNNADRKGGHILLNSTGKLWGIDHGLTFHPHNKLRTVIWEFAGQPIAEALIGDINMLCEKVETTGSPLRQQLAPLLQPIEIDALRGRVQRLIAEPTFPQPGPGPNHPWPPV